MLTSDLALDGRAGTETTFVMLPQNNGVTTRVDNTSTISEPNTLEIQHSSTGPAGGLTDRHLIRRTKKVLDAAGQTRVATVNLTVNVPRTAAITQDDILDMVAHIVDLITDGGFSGSGFAGTTALQAVLRGES
jgi:hypothetical protein